MADRGVESWIASLRDTHASRLASPVVAAEKTILDTFGPTSIESLGKLNQASFISKTSLDTSASVQSKSSPTFKAWVTKLRAASLRRRKLVPHIDESESSFSAWRTPATSEVGTPIEALTSKDGGAPQIGHRMYRKGKNGEEINQTQTLGLQVSLWSREKGGPWPTPTLKGDHNRAGLSPAAGDGLATKAINWPTPTANLDNSSIEAVDARKKRCRERYEAGEYGDGCGPPNLNHLNYAAQVLQRKLANWPTPVASANANRTTQNAPSHGSTHGATLAGTAAQWPTPMSKDWKSGSVSPETLAKNSRPLNEFAIHCFHLPPTISKPGKKSLKGSRGCAPQLNPVFVSWLMGWPLIASSIYDSLGTEWFLFRLRMRSSLFGLVSGIANATSH